ncbi:MAG: carbohydrate binding domain-containing protein [Pyrinomonadaceae bacterium]|nr:carbohydrate binding domain-containing protein [Pyrinomonadaceae bacterium]MCX7638999.1 carbohydrate binding domain-containing protein [Pyrinomonadaceae bacterium]MDW8303781.1 carbohydrate binding domain-containing protein [Acidobacteriota bacterium]
MRLTQPKLISILMVIAAIIFGWTAIRFQLANMLAENISPFNPEARVTAEYALWLSPSDPMVNWFLATSNRMLPAKEITKRYEQTVRLAPNDFRWWVELSRAREQSEDVESAEKAILQAINLAPSYVYPRWQAGNFYLRQGKVDQALQEFQKAIEHNTIYRQQVFSVLWDYFNKDLKMLDQITSSVPSSKVDLALFLAAKDRPNESLSIWQSLSKEYKAEREQTARVIIQGLFDKRFFLSAVQFSKEIGIDENAEPEKITNPSFELPLYLESQRYFDWKIIPAEKTDIVPDVSQKKEGRRSVRVRFNGFFGIHFYHFYQIVAVQPSTKYSLSFWYKAEKVKSAGPPTIEIVNANDDKLVKASEPLTDTEEWKKVELIFITPENAEGISVRIGRIPCGSQCPLFGTIWLDDFELRKL